MTLVHGVNARPLVSWVQPPAKRAMRAFLSSIYNLNYIVNLEIFSEVFLNPETGDVWKTGDVYTRPTFAKTLEAIAGLVTNSILFLLILVIKYVIDLPGGQINDLWRIFCSLLVIHAIVLVTDGLKKE